MPKPEHQRKWFLASESSINYDEATRSREELRKMIRNMEDKINELVAHLDHTSSNQNTSTNIAAQMDLLTRMEILDITMT